MKGIELPVNTLIIIILALIVLVAFSAFFLNVWRSGSQSITLEGAKNSACQIYVSLGCTGSPSSVIVKNFDADQDENTDDGSGTGDCEDKSPTATSQDNLWMLAKCYYNAADPDNFVGTTLCSCGT